MLIILHSLDLFAHYMLKDSQKKHIIFKEKDENYNRPCEALPMLK
jgi:hypothetical protein